MSYREHAPPPPLAPWLACIWEHYADAAPIRVLPDGCIDVVWTEDAGTQIVGANTTAFLVSLTAGTHVVGARLRPGAAPALLGIAAEALRDARLPIADVWVAEGPRLAARLDAAVDPVDALRAAMLARALRCERPDGLVGKVVRQLELSSVAIGALAQELAVSERQLRRRVAAAVGYGPKRLARVLRLRRALDAVHSDSDLARVALDTGYADQAHFANECRALAGVPPSLLLAS